MPTKASQSPRRPSATRTNSATTTNEAPLTLNRAHVQGFITGCVVGVAVCLGLMRSTEEPDQSIAAPAPPLSVEAEASPRFDFYTVLPNQALDLSPEIEPADLEADNNIREQYLLQAGSFRQQADADRRRGELALLGLEATVEPSENKSGRWYRVYLGPFDSRSDMARARSLTAQADIDTLLLKREAP